MLYVLLQIEFEIKVYLYKLFTLNICHTVLGMKPFFCCYIGFESKWTMCNHLSNNLVFV